jgi:hypothetical protein
MSSIISKASQAIKNWNEERNNPIAVINYFNKGTYFQVSKEDYLIWESNSPEFIHAYMGLTIKPTESHFSLSLFSVDNVTDKEPVASNEAAFDAKTKENIYELSVITDPSLKLIAESNGITPIEGLMRTVQWSLHKDKWMNEQEDLVQVFQIPFIDFQVLFEEESADFVIISPALKEQDENNVFKIDLVLWGYNTDGVTWHKPMDLIRPRPPFKKKSNYQLLNYSLQ